MCRGCCEIDVKQGFSFFASKAIGGDHERGKMTMLLEASLKMLLLFLPFFVVQDLERRVLGTIRCSIDISVMRTLMMQSVPRDHSLQMITSPQSSPQFL
jgi:hypothetical protein